MQYGLAASIPWVTMGLTKTNNITIHEYQYVNIVDGGMLKTITNLDHTVYPNTKDVTKLNSG